MSGEREVFIDALMELGFGASRQLPVPGDESVIWRGVRIFSDGERGSVVVVNLASFYVHTIWSYGYLPNGLWAKDSDPKRNHTFGFPAQWPQIIVHVKKLIELAIHKAQTGETLPVPPPGSIF